MPSPTKESLPSFPPSLATQSYLYPPPSPSTHRNLRKLASAHNLGSTARNSTSIYTTNTSAISQQRILQEQRQRLRQISPTRRHNSPSKEGGANTSRSAVHGAAIEPRRRARASSDGSAHDPRQLEAAQTRTGTANLTHGVTPPSSKKAAATASASRITKSWSLEKLFQEGPQNQDVNESLTALRRKILDGQMKSDTDGMSINRIYIWLALLDTPVLKTDEYLALVHRGASPAYNKIRNDTFRTLTTDPLFKRKVSEASLIRLLNAIAWRLHDASGGGISARQSLPSLDESSPRYNAVPGGINILPNRNSPAAKHRARALTLTTEGSESGLPTEAGTYVQGMNVLAAPFLYAAKSEAEAFVAFHQLLTKTCPGYIRGAMDGVHKGLVLVDKVLAIVDPELSGYLISKGMPAELYAFPSVLTLCACTPPLPEVLRLWDFLFAYGPHLNIVCIAAQLVLHRDKILSDPSPSKFLRTFPTLEAGRTQSVALSIISRLPDDVYAEIVEHAQ